MLSINGGRPSVEHKAIKTSVLHGLILLPELGKTRARRVFDTKTRSFQLTRPVGVSTLQCQGLERRRRRHPGTVPIWPLPPRSVSRQEAPLLKCGAHGVMTPPTCRS
jgi:hypothetical protein